MSEPRTSVMSAWLIGLFLGAIDSILLFELGYIGIAFTLICLLVLAWKGPPLAASSGLVSGIGVAGTLVFARVLLRCAGDNLAASGSCDPGGIGVWVAAAAGILAVGLAGTLLDARRARRGR